MGWFNRKAHRPTEPDLLTFYRERVGMLEAENARLRSELRATPTNPDPAADAAPEVGQLPDEVEEAIRARFSYSPIASGLTRTAVRNLMRTHRDIDPLRVLGNLGEQA